MWNMDEKGFILGKANRAKVVARAGRLPPRTTHDGTRELITVIEACGAKQGMLPPMGGGQGVEVQGQEATVCHQTGTQGLGGQWVLLKGHASSQSSQRVEKLHHQRRKEPKTIQDP